MSNGLKVGLLVVIAGALAFLGFSLKSHNDNTIAVRPIETVDGTTSPERGANVTAVNQKDGGATTTTASASRTKTTLTFDKTEHDFGRIKQGDSVECAFKVTNTGNEPLVIEDAKGSCGCTVPEYPKEPIPPGQSRDIKVKFNSAGKRDNQQKTVTLTANTDLLQSVLTIKAFVEAPAGEEQKGEKGKSH